MSSSGVRLAPQYRLEEVKMEKTYSKRAISYELAVAVRENKRLTAQKLG